jgi:CHAT domain-containing protein/tetratricopeptide (TPR) repeat protein
MLLEGKRLASLANEGIDPINNLNKAIALWQNTKKGFEKGSHNYAACLSNEGGARAQLAELGEKTKENLGLSLLLFVEARNTGLKPNTLSYAINLMSEGNARLRLAIIGVEPETNLRRSIELQKLSRDNGFQPDKIDYAKSLLNEGTAKMMLGELVSDPIENFRESIHLYEESRLHGLLEPSFDFANSLLNEGTVRKKLANLGVETLPNLRQSIILFRKARDIYKSNTTNYAETLINEANAHACLAKFGFSRPMNLNSAIDLYKKTRELDAVKNTILCGRSLENEGAARLDLARLGVESKTNLQEAIRLFVEARKEGIKSGTLEFELTLLNEGAARIELGKLGVNQENNFDVAKSVLNQANSFFIESKVLQYLILGYSNLGELYFVKEEYLDAFLNFSKAIELIEALRTSMKTPEFKKGYLETMVAIYKRMVFTCVYLDKSEDAFHFAELIKGRTFLDMISSGKRTIKGPPTLLNNYYENLRQIERIEMNFFGRPMPPDIEMTLRILKNNHEKLLSSIKQYDLKYYGVETAETISIGELKQILKGKTLLEYFVGERIIAFVLNDNLKVRLVGGTNEEIHKLVSELRHLLESTPNSQGTNLDELLKKTDDRLSNLYDLLIKPVIDLLGKNIVIVPHDVLHMIPFQALKGERSMVEDFAISLAQSASALKYMKSSQNEGIFIVGNPTQDLEYSETEAVEIGRLFDVSPILGSNAKKDEILRNIGTKKILHFACHGFFDQANPAFSGIVLNDGILTATDFMNMTVDAELLVLSACETAKSGITLGDEIESLVRAIHYSGSRFIIASLWIVADESTCKLLIDFYRRPEEFDERLRLSEVKLKNQGYPVYYWAPFQIYGI